MHGRTMMPPAVKVNSPSIYPGGYHHVNMFQSNNQLVDVIKNSNNSNYQQYAQHAAPVGRIYATESASPPDNDLAGLVLNPPVGSTVGGVSKFHQYLRVNWK